MQIIKYHNIYFAISGLLVGASLVVIALYGLNLGIDFTGGSLMEIKVHQDVQTSARAIQAILTESSENHDALLESAQVQPTEDNGFLLRFKNVSEDEHQKILSYLNAKLSEGVEIDENSSPTARGGDEGGVGAQSGIPDVTGLQATDAEGNPVDISFEPVNDGVISSPVITIGGTQVVEEQRFESIGPIIGEELKDKAIESMIVVLIAIVLYIAWAFRKVSDPVSSWKYGLVAIAALVHDVSIPVGVFVILGKFAGVEIDILFVTALLTILGYSVNDTIVVFDRTRENLAKDHHAHDFDYLVNKSVNETIRRSLFTALTTFLVLLAIYLYGGESIKNFVLALMIGVVAGTYSSIFLASPLLVVWEKWSRKK